jgi:sporulation protein YtfJ
MKNENVEKISVLMETVMKNLSSMVDVNTIVGSPVYTDDGGCVIPISKVTIAFLTGAGENAKVKVLSKKQEQPFTGGSGAILSLKPSGFLVKNKDSFKLMPATNEPYNKLFDIVSDYFSTVNSMEE